jgi:hypothetical protein
MIHKHPTSYILLSTAIAALCLLTAVLCPPVWAGGSWLADGVAVQPPVDDLAALHTDGSRKMDAPLNFDISASVPNSGIINAYIPWSGGYSDIFVMDEDNEVMWLASDQNVSFGVGSLFISSGQLTSFDYGSTINFEERSLGGGGWWVNSVLDDPNAIISRSYADSRYHRTSAITTPLKFDASLSSSVNGLFKATVPWDSEYEFFTFNPTYETLVLSPTLSSLGFEAAGLILYGYGTIKLDGESTYISFEERLFGGGGWFVSTVENDPLSIMNRSYADNRYVQKSSGITTNYTVQAGDVLQIQNGVITAINP